MFGLRSPAFPGHQGALVCAQPSTPRKGSQLSSETPPLRRDPTFLRLWVASTAAGLAHWAFPFALGLAVAHGALQLAALGWILALRTIGFLVAVPISGVLADRVPRKRVLTVAGCLAAAATLVAALALDSTIVVSGLAATVIGAGQGAYRPALQALVADVVDVERRQAANAANSLAVRVTVLLGPVLVTAASRVVDIEIVIALLGPLWLIAALVPPSSEAAPAPSAEASGGFVRRFARELGEGVTEARRHPWFPRVLGALSLVIMFGYSATGVALPLVSKERFGGDAVLAAGTMGYTLGALGGAMLMVRWRPANAGWHALAGLGVYALVPLSLALSSSPAFIVVAYLLAGLGIEVFNVPWFTATQREVPAHALARVSSLDFLLSYGLAPLGLAALAPAMTAFGATPVLLACAAVCVLAPAAALLEPSAREFRRIAPEATPAVPKGSS